MTGEDRVKATMRVVSVGRCQSSIDLDPVYAVDLLVSSPGRPPRAVATSLRVPLGAAERFAAGTEVPVELSSTDASVFKVDWAGLV
ncbi:MAG TPA: hypothetical protein VHZ02_16445 [Acidimicrobiales bacterium]|jgi:hypothetical protein|nr:hypothetical protein [Acidimicrobiales bacterium]